MQTDRGNTRQVSRESLNVIDAQAPEVGHGGECPGLKLHFANP